MEWPERLFNAEMVPAGTVQRDVELSGLPTRKVQKMMREIWKEKGSQDYDPYLLFRHARDRGLYRRSTKTEQAISELRCLALVGRVPAQNLLHNAIPTGNIIHVLERMLAQSMIREYQFMVYLLRYLLGCSARVAMTYAEHSNSLLEILRTAENNGNIDNLTMVVSLHSFYFLLDPREIHRISHQEGTSVGDFERIAEYTEAHGLASMNIARIRQWQPISRDEIQEVFDSGRRLTEQETKDEIYIRRLMKKHNIDRTDASTAFHESDRVLENANKACIEIAQNIQQKLAEELPTLPTRDTRCPPDVTAKTRVIAILGTHEEYAGAVTACPSIGDGWIVSDFYLWLHVLRGMGRSQKWITSMKPSDLVQKYGMEDKVTQVVVDADLDIRKPIQTRKLEHTARLQKGPWPLRAVVTGIFRVHLIQHCLNDLHTLSGHYSNIGLGPDILQVYRHLSCRKGIDCH